MSDKQVYELTQQDIELHPVWFFPMDDSVEDELTIRPFTDNISVEDYQIIVRAHFTTSLGEKYLGYVYWNKPISIDNIQPVLFVNNEECITFWNGMFEPTWDDYGSKQIEIRAQLPIYYCSDEVQGLSSLQGKIEGLYYIDKVVKFIK